MDIENLSNESDSLATDCGYDSMVSFDEDDADDDDGLMHLNVEVVELFERLLSWMDQVQQIDILQDWMIDDE